MAVRISSSAGPQIPAARSNAASASARSQTLQTPEVSAQSRIRPTQIRMQSTQRVVTQAQVAEVEGRIRERAMKRVDVLVQGLETLAKRISSEKVSTSQRSVLVSRFNDLQRQVNRIDGIVGGEGQETQGVKALNQALGADAGVTGAENEEPMEQVQTIRQRLQNERSGIAVQRREARQTIEQELQDMQGEVTPPEPDTVQATAQTIRSQETNALEAALGGNMVDLQV